MRSLISGALAIGVLACSSTSGSDASAGQAATLTPRQAQLRAAAEMLFELTESVDPYTNQTTLSRVLELMKSTSCGGTWLVPRPSFDTEYKKGFNVADFPDGQAFSEATLAGLRANRLALELQSLAMGEAAKAIDPAVQKQISEGVERLATATVPLMVLRLDAVTRSGQDYIGVLAAQSVKYQACLTGELKQALDAAEVVRNRAMIERVTSGAATRLLEGANLQSLMASRSAFQKLFDSALAKNPDSGKAVAHVREVEKQVETPELLKSRTDLGRAIREAR